MKGWKNQSLPKVPAPRFDRGTQADLLLVSNSLPRLTRSQAEPAWSGWGLWWSLQESFGDSWKNRTGSH